jgi:predicted secreted protein
LLSNLGVPGLLLFVLFVVLLLRLRTQAPMPAHADEAKPLVRAAKNGVFATLISAVISGTGYDLGLVFYMLAGFITAQAVSSADGPQLFYRPAQAAYPKSQNGS